MTQPSRTVILDDTGGSEQKPTENSSSQGSTDRQLVLRLFWTDSGLRWKRSLFRWPLVLAQTFEFSFLSSFSKRYDFELFI